MQQEGTRLNGEASALIRAETSRAAEPLAPPQWLADLKATAQEMQQRRERPPGKASGRWLGDFLDQDTPSGLLPAEEALLFAAVHGEPCVLKSRAVFLWDAFEAWRETMPEAPEGELSFVEAIARFTEAAPEPVQDIIIDATRHAIEELQLPAYWEPQSVADVEKFALAQRRFLARLEAEAHPAQTVEQARRDERFYHLAVQAVIESLTPKPYEPLQLHHEWLNPMLLRDPLNLSAETRARIDAEPRPLRGFFDDLLREVKFLDGGEPNRADSFEADPGLLRERFDAVLSRYEREQWRWIDPEDADIRVRARFLRFLALGGDDFAPVHESGLDLSGAFIAEDLDLSGCTIRQPLLFRRCYFDGRISLREAVTKSLNLSASAVLSIDAEGVHIMGGLRLEMGFYAQGGVAFPFATISGTLSCSGGVLRYGGGPALNGRGAVISGDADLKGCFLGEGAVSLHTARIGGNLNCAGSTFRNRTGDGSNAALDCGNAQIAGNVTLSNGFRAQGCVSLSHAKIGGDVDCAEGTFCNRAADGTGVALTADASEIAGDVHLRHGCHAEGLVRLCGAHIKGSVTFYGSRFENATPQKSLRSFTLRRRTADAISLAGSRIDQVLWLDGAGGGTAGRASIFGSLNLAGCHAHELVDHPASWPKKTAPGGTGKRLRTHIILDGFTYARFAACSDLDVATRKKWLDRQPVRGHGFRPQPYEQLITVYRKMGYESRAREISKFKERRRYRALLMGLWHDWWKPPDNAASLGPAPLGSVASPFVIVPRAAYRLLASVALAAIWAFVGFCTAYWYGWGRLTLFLLALWAMGGLFYREVAVQGGFAPSNPVISLNKDLEAKCGRNWTDCKSAPTVLPGFSPFTYSLDIMLPLLDLGQKREWQLIERPDKPVIMVSPKLAWYPGDDLPDIVIRESPLVPGTVDKIAKVQTLLSWGALGLLLATLLKLVKKD